MNGYYNQSNNVGSNNVVSIDTTTFDSLATAINTNSDLKYYLGIHLNIHLNNHVKKHFYIFVPFELRNLLAIFLLYFK